MLLVCLLLDEVEYIFVFLNLIKFDKIEMRRKFCKFLNVF